MPAACSAASARASGSKIRRASARVRGAREGRAAHALLEGLALVPGHDEPEALLVPAVVLELHERGVEDGGVHAQLAQRGLTRRLAERGLAQELERHPVARHLGVVGAVDVAEGADADALHDGVAPADQLLEAGADASIADRQGRTPLDHARARGYAEMVRMLEATAR